MAPRSVDVRGEQTGRRRRRDHRVLLAVLLPWSVLLPHQPDRHERAQRLRFTRQGRPSGHRRQRVRRTRTNNGGRTSSLGDWPLRVPHCHGDWDAGGRGGRSRGGLPRRPPHAHCGCSSVASGAVRHLDHLGPLRSVDHQALTHHRRLLVAGVGPTRARRGAHVTGARLRPRVAHHGRLPDVVSSTSTSSPTHSVS